MFFTPEERKEIHEQALNSEENGSLHEISWKIFPKVTKPMEIQDDQLVATNALAKLIYTNQSYASIGLDLYKALLQKIRMYYGADEVAVLVKGSSALAFYFMGMDDMKDVFPFSDLDISIYINPVNPERFVRIRHHISMIVGQTFAKHKQCLDRTFFRTTGNVQGALDIDVQEFMDDHIEAFDDHGMTSPFVNSQVRNKSSNHSFSILQSNKCPDSVVRIDEPHFSYAEKIPLYKTPIFCSINNTINTDIDGRKNHFDLYRMKWGALGTRNGPIGIDFIDCVIPDIDDSDLKDFISKGGFEYSKFTTCIMRYGYAVHVPKLEHCYNDLWNTLNLYDCPDCKKKSRENKLNKLKEFMWGALASENEVEMPSTP